MKIEFIIITHGETYPEDATTLDVGMVTLNIKKKNNLIWIAEAAAQQYWDDGHGNKDSWPLEFKLIIDGKRAGVFEVDVKTVPVFTARAK